jgi:hypothetical protein
MADQCRNGPVRDTEPPALCSALPFHDGVPARRYRWHRSFTDGLRRTGHHQAHDLMGRERGAGVRDTREKGTAAYRREPESGWRPAQVDRRWPAAPQPREEWQGHHPPHALR